MFKINPTENLGSIVNLLESGLNRPARFHVKRHPTDLDFLLDSLESQKDILTVENSFTARHLAYAYMRGLNRPLNRFDIKADLTLDELNVESSISRFAKMYNVDEIAIKVISVTEIGCLLMADYTIGGVQRRKMEFLVIPSTIVPFTISNMDVDLETKLLEFQMDRCREAYECLTTSTNVTPMFLASALVWYQNPELYVKFGNNDFFDRAVQEQVMDYNEGVSDVFNMFFNKSKFLSDKINDVNHDIIDIAHKLKKIKTPKPKVALGEELKARMAATFAALFTKTGDSAVNSNTVRRTLPTIAKFNNRNTIRSVAEFVSGRSTTMSGLDNDFNGFSHLFSNPKRYVRIGDRLTREVSMPSKISKFFGSNKTLFVSQLLGFVDLLTFTVTKSSELDYSVGIYRNHIDMTIFNKLQENVEMLDIKVLIELSDACDRFSGYKDDYSLLEKALKTKITKDPTVSFAIEQYNIAKKMKGLLGKMEIQSLKSKLVFLTQIKQIMNAHYKYYKG